MYVEIIKNHPQSKKFIQMVKKNCTVTALNEYEVSTYIETEEPFINFLSAINHDIVHIAKNGKLVSFPIAMFGTIYRF